MLWEKDFDVVIEDSDYESKIRGLFRGKASQSIGIRITLRKCTYARTFDEIVIDLTDCWRREFIYLIRTILQMGCLKFSDKQILE